MRQRLISHFQARELIAARKRGDRQCEISLDLGRSLCLVQLSDAGVDLGDSEPLPWTRMKKILKNEMTCFAVHGGELSKVSEFSEMTNRVYSLCPTSTSPTMLVSGFLMHRIKDTDPQADTAEKVKALGPVHGRVLDTCTGLGYTAIAIARNGARVTTIELDPAAQEICRQNPWSRELFELENIEQLIGDSASLVKTLDSSSFSGILHDPPDMSLGGQLYATEFYRELHRLLADGGRLFHYVGNPDSAKMGKLIRQAGERLAAVGFDRIRQEKSAFGLSAVCRKRAGTA